jgi:hypothetical protein
LSTKFIVETLTTLDNWQTGPISDELFILYKIISHSIYMLQSTLVGRHKYTQNDMVILHNSSDLAPTLYGHLHTELKKPQPVTVKILLDSCTSASIIKHQFI